MGMGGCTDPLPWRRSEALTREAGEGQGDNPSLTRLGEGEEGQGGRGRWARQKKRRALSVRSGDRCKRYSYFSTNHYRDLTLAEIDQEFSRVKDAGVLWRHT